MLVVSHYLLPIFFAKKYNCMVEFVKVMHKVLLVPFSLDTVFPYRAWLVKNVGVCGSE